MSCFTVMASRRTSKRLKGEEPEIKDTRFRCLCMVEGEACDRGVTQQSCCKKFLHTKCVNQWYARGQRTCPMCRQIPTIPVQSTLPLVREGMTREEVIDRLDNLLQDPQLRAEIERVSLFLFCRWR